jgi:hypothetical protein
MNPQLAAISLAVLTPLAPAAAQDARMRDSAGVRIVENPARNRPAHRPPAVRAVTGTYDRTPSAELR